jgi:hypothetical protein
VENFGMFMITYSSIIVAFTLSFGILFDEKKVNDEEKTFGNIYHSFMTTLIMMTGEIELTKVMQQTKTPLYVMTYVMFIVFILLVTGMYIYI